MPPFILYADFFVFLGTLRWVHDPEDNCAHYIA